MEKTIVMCPNCGTQFEIAQHEHTTVATVIGEDSGLGVIKLTPKSEQDCIDTDSASASAQAVPVSARPISHSMAKLEEMKKAGLPVDNFFSISNEQAGVDFIARKTDDGNVESFTFEQIDGLISDYIRKNGHIRNSRLFRRWIMAQVYHMLADKEGFLGALRRKGYEYSWKMVINELQVVAKLRLNDRECFIERKRFFTKEVIVAMAEHVIEEAKKTIEAARVRKCKRRPYKSFYGKQVFVDEIESKFFAPLYAALDRLKRSTSKSLLANTINFDNVRPKFSYDAPMCHIFENAYKAAGAYYTLKNLILFHNVKMVDADNNLIDDVDAGLAYLNERATTDCEAGEGYKLMGALKRVTEMNGFNYEDRMRQLGVRK